MKYKYLYQTKENANREGWISARDRAEAYAALRKQGIRPYRLIGDDPSPVRRAAPAIAAAAAFLALAALALAALFAGGREAPASRRQLVGDPGAISAGMADGWTDLFPAKLDRHLAAYAQPGWIALPPEPEDGDEELFARELAEPFSTGAADSPEKRLLKGIVSAMRDEMKGYIEGGGSVADYLEFLEDRQDQEREFRNKAVDAIARAPESMRDRVRMNVNVRLREMGLPEAN